MISDWELWACAYRTVSDHGPGAAAEAAARATELAGRGDAAGEAVRRDIASRIAVLQAERPVSVPLN